MAVLAHLDPPQRAPDRRRAARRTLSLEVHDGQDVGSSSVVIHDISVTGLLLETSADLDIGDQINVVIPHGGATVARIVWKGGTYFGCEFSRPITPATVSAALLRSPAAPADAQTGRDPEPVDTESQSNTDRLPASQRFYLIVGLAVISWAVIIAAIVGYR